MITTLHRITTAIIITMAGTETETETGTEIETETEIETGTETETEIKTGRDTRTEEMETELHNSGTEILKSISDCVLS